MNLGAIFALLQTALLLLSSVQTPNIPEELRQQALNFSYQIVEIATKELAGLTLPMIDESGITISSPIISPQLSGVVQPSIPPLIISLEAQAVQRYGTNFSETRYLTEEPLEIRSNSFDTLRFLIIAQNYDLDSGSLSCNKTGDWDGQIEINSWNEGIKISRNGSYLIKCFHEGIEIFSDKIDLFVI